MIVYALTRNFVVDMEDGSNPVIINDLHGRFRFEGVKTIIQDAGLLDKMYIDLTTNVKDQGGTPIGNEAAVMAALDVIMGS